MKIIFQTYCCLFIGALISDSLRCQTPITQTNPQFKAGVPYKSGSFTLVIHEGPDGKGEAACIQIDSRGKLLSDGFGSCASGPPPMLTIGSSDKRITSAIVEVFYQTYVEGLKTAGPLLLHQELTCPIIQREPVGACNQNLTIPASAIKMIRIKGSAEVEAVEIGKP